MARAAALNWITFIKALTASLLAESSECHFPNPTYRFQDLTSPRTNVAFKFCKNDFIYCWKPLQHFRGKATKKIWLYLIAALVSPLVEYTSGWLVQRYCPRAELHSCTAVSLLWPGHCHPGLQWLVWARPGVQARGCSGASAWVDNPPSQGNGSWQLGEQSVTTVLDGAFVPRVGAL